MRATFLVALPDILIIELLAHWFTPMELCKLDSAVCNNRDRLTLILSLQSTFCVVKSTMFVPAMGSEFLRWTSLREIKFQRFMFFFKTDEKDHLHSLKLANVKTLELQSARTENDPTEEQLVNLINGCSKLNTLKVKQSLRNFTEQVTDHINPSIYTQLTTLDIISCTMSHRLIEPLWKHCTALRTLQIGLAKPVQTSDLIKLVRANPHLRQIGFNIIVSDSVNPLVDAIAETCSDLRTLSTVASKVNSLDCLAKLITSCVKLDTFHVQGQSVHTYASMQKNWCLLKI